MKNAKMWATVNGCALLLLLLSARSVSKAQTEKKASDEDETAIRALEGKFTAAVNAGDIDAIMKNYISGTSLIVFDVVPRKQSSGADAYRRDWEDFFSHFKGKPRIVITNLGITVDGNLGFGHSIQHVTGIDKEGHPVNRTVRVSNGYRKIRGKWLIALEHVSMPVDLKTGKAVVNSGL